MSLCGTSEHAMLWMLEQNPNIQSVCLCLDHDEAGIEASGRLADSLHERGYDSVGMLQPEYKDWNEDVKALRGLSAQEAEEHPQLIIAPEICDRIVQRMAVSRPEYWEQDLPNLIDYFRTSLRMGCADRAMECMEQASAQALAVYGREMRQLGEPRSAEKLEEELCRRIQPHQNKSSIKNRAGELAAQFQGVLAKANAPGIRNETNKRELADSWLELAASFAKVPVKHEADILKQQQKQEQSMLKQEMG